MQHVYAAGGTYTVSMTATDSAGGMATASTVLAVRAAAPMAVSVVAGPMVPAGGGPKAIVSFTATVIPASAVIESYLWDFGDGGGVQRTTANQVQHVFANPGLYTVTVTVTEALTERTAVGTVPVSTASGMPIVSIAASANPVAGRATTFTIGAAVAAGSSVTMQNVRVTFGDGTPPVDLGGVIGSGLAAGHVYASAGTYLASVTATDSVRGTATASIQVVVAAPSAPSVSVTVGANPLAGTPTTFTITAAPAAGSGTTIQNVQVTFGDGTAPVDLGAVNGTTTTQHVYTAGGSYIVSATATDSGGTTATASTQAEVAAPGAPTVSVTASANPIAGTATTFTVAAAPAPGSNTTVQNVRVTFGDGTAPVDLGAVSTSTTTQHVYAAGGSYTVSVTATASNGATGTASIQVVVAAPNAPSVSVTASANPVAGTATTFTITAAPAAGSNTTIQNVQVTFGDGTAPVNLGAVSGSTTTQHVYAAAGSFTVSATATASNGATATASTQVVVAAPGAPTVSVTASANPVAGIATTFTITAAPAAGSNTTIQYVQVTFGDGTAPVEPRRRRQLHDHAACLRGRRELHRIGHGDGEQRCDGHRVHAGGGRGRPGQFAERVRDRQRQPGRGHRDHVHHHRGPRGGEQHHHPERAGDVRRRHGPRKPRRRQRLHHHAACLRGRREFHRDGDGDGEQQRHRQHDHAGGGYRAGRAERIGDRQRQPDRGPRHDIHRHRGARAGQQLHHPDLCG